MNLHLIFIVTMLILGYVHSYSAIETIPELKKKVLNFGYGASFKYEGMWSHSFDRFYVVTSLKYQK